MKYRDLYWTTDKLRWVARRALIGGALIVVLVSAMKCANARWSSAAVSDRPPLPGNFEARYARMKAGLAPWQDTAVQLEGIRLGEALKVAVAKYEAGR